MADDNSLFDRVRDRVAALASTEDNNPSPQARDEDPFVVGREEFREEVDKNEIDRFIREYNRNPLIRVPIQNFAADVLEPGVSASVDLPEDMDMPTVPESAIIPATYHGRDLDDALESWMSTAYIDGFSFDASLADLLEQVVKDRRGRRGTAVVEHAYDDPRERDRLMALRPIKTETLTFYQREGKRIVLREDDDATEFDSVSISDRGDPTRNKAPTTPAGKTAAAAQFDDIFGGSQEHDEIPFALSDLTITAFDADTGDLLGRPDSATVLNRAASLRKKMRHVDQSVLNTAFGNVIATVESQDAEVVRQVRDNLDVNVKERNEDIDPETVSATNAPVEIEEIDSSVPDVTDIIQQEIEFILTALPTPLYRVGFAGDINRDVTSEQGEDYRDAVNRERRHLESTFSKPLEMKAREWMHGDPHSTQPLDVDVRLRIRPSQADSPLRDEEFDASEFSNLASALKQVAPGGEVAQLMPAHEIREMLLDIDPELPDPPESAASEPDLSLPSETDDEIQQTFDDLYDTNLAGESFADNPVIPTGLEELSDAWLVRWAEWVAAGRPEIPESERLAEIAALDWNPELHPRDPRTGQFVERPFDPPDDAPDFSEQSRRETLKFLDDNGADLSDIFDPDSPITVDGIPNDATGLEDVPEDDGDVSAAELRRGVDTVETGDEIVPESVEPGDVVQVGTGRLSKYVEVEEVDTSFNSPILRGTDASGSEVAAPTDGKAVLEADRVETPDFNLDWSDDLDSRADTTLTAIEESVPTGTDAPLDYGTIPLPEGGEGFDGVDSAEQWLDEVRPQLAEGLAAARDAEVAERTLEHWGQLGDHGSAAADGSGNTRNFSGRTRVAGDDRHAIKLATLNEATAKHEVAHNLFKSFQLQGQSNDVAHDYKGDIPDFDLTSDPDAPDDIDQYTLSPPDETPLETDDIGRSFGRGEWESRVRNEVSSDLSANRFSTPDDFESWATEDAEAGDMLRFEEYPLQTFDEDGPQNYRIAETLGADDVDVVGARRGFELEGPGGESFRVGVRRGGEIRSEDIHETSGFLPEVRKKRNGTPDGWGQETPELDEVLGNDDPSDSPEERIHRVGREANAAWFKMNLIKQNEGESVAEEAVIGNNYSATNTHETLARLHEYMQANVSPTTRQNTAVALVKHHPRLLESYRHAFEISDEMKGDINSALAGTDAEVRL